jgi:anti-sigma regulatory factor (Ser/Thr protein kinase)
VPPASHKSVLIPVRDESAVGSARRAAVSLANALGLSETERGNLAIIAAELATNVVRHAGAGELILRALGDEARAGVELLALDKGPGIRDIGQARTDGFSTAGTPGNGLGAIERLSSFTDIYSSPGLGTAVLATIWARGDGPRGAKPEADTHGVVCVPKSGEESCGDDWAIIPRDDRHELYFVADGLGHGPGAADASATARRIAVAERRLDPATIIQACHAAMRGTRGAAVAIADVDPRDGTIRFAGVGNVAATIVMPGESRSLVSHNGTVGHEMRRVTEFAYTIPNGALLIMMSDGVSTHARLDNYPGLWARHPALVAGVLYRDFTRGRDDATLLVARPRSTAVGS